MLNFLMFFKYSFSSLIIMLNNDFYTPTYYFKIISSDSNLFGIILIIIELISVFFTVYLFSDFFYGEKENRDNKLKAITTKKIINKSHESIKIINKSYEPIKIGVFIIGVLFVLLLVVIKNFSLFIPHNVINFRDSTFEISSSNDSIQVLFSIFKILIMGLLINHFIVRYQQNNKVKYIYLSYITIIVFCILNLSTSRRSMTLPFLLFLLITYDIFKSKGKIALIGVFCVFIPLLSAVTIYKSPWLYKEDTSVKSVIKNSTIGIQEYTSNVRPVAIGIEMDNYFHSYITYNTFANDILGSIPFISHFINQQDRINYYYNYYILNGVNTSQIVPMIIVGYSYFGLAFCWIPTIICVICLMYFERKSSVRIKYNFLERYLDLYLFFVFVSVLDSNTQMIFSRLINNYIPILIILKFNKVLLIKRGGIINAKT